jgi:hypothetical protein
VPVNVRDTVGEIFANGVPQFPQNRIPMGLLKPQFEHLGLFMAQVYQGQAIFYARSVTDD